VDHLQGARHAQRAFLVTAKKPSRLQAQNPPQTLPPSQDRVAHRLMNRRRVSVGSGQKAAERLIHPSALLFEMAYFKSRGH